MLLSNVAEVNIKRRVGQRIKEARKAKGLTQKELGNKLGVADSVITNYESGKQNLTIDTLEKIANAIGIDISILFN